MKKLNHFLLIITFLLAFIHVNAQVIEKYEVETIYLQSSKYIKNGNAYPIGFMSNRLKKEMTVSPDALGVFEKYQKSSRWAFGLAIVAFGTALIASGTENKSLKSGLFAVTIASSFVGFPLVRRAGKNFNKAIWLRNRDVLK